MIDRTSQVFSETPSFAAAASARDFSASGSRRVVRDVEASSVVAAARRPATAARAPSELAAATGAKLEQRGRGDGELDVATAQAHVDGARREVARDLAGRVGQRVEDGQPCGRVERGGQPARDLFGLGTARGGRGQQLALQRLDVRGDLHDTTLTPL